VALRLLAIVQTVKGLKEALVPVAQMARAEVSEAVSQMEAARMVLAQPELPLVLARPEFALVLARLELPLVLALPELPLVLARPEPVRSLVRKRAAQQARLPLGQTLLMCRNEPMSRVQFVHQVLRQSMVWLEK
jgi:hypothetical protein